jgi:hypothetical protein
VLQVLYVDYGNSEVIENARLAVLPITASSLPAQTKSYKLAAVSAAPQEWNETVLSYVRVRGSVDVMCVQSYSINLCSHLSLTTSLQSCHGNATQQDRACCRLVH